MAKIELNSDLGEGFGPWAMGDDTTTLALVSSANVACGGHAGDPETMCATLVLAQAWGGVVGAHPGFGRRVIEMALAEFGRMVAAQVGALMGVAALAGEPVALRGQSICVHGDSPGATAMARQIRDALQGVGTGDRAFQG